MKAIGVFIFGGSATFGVEESGYNIDRILELTNDMTENNAYHFTKNRPDIPIINPSEWENDTYLSQLKNENFDLLYSNCPCSSLSQINKNASVDGDKNIHFYRACNAIKNIEPKAFFIENAPTFIKLGYPILKDIVKSLGDKYKFTIIRDYAGNHGVAMKRMRTLIVGWKKDAFNNQIPLVQMNLQPQLKAKDIFKDLYNYAVGDNTINNHTLIQDDEWTPVEYLFNYVNPDNSALLSFINNWDVISTTLTHQPVIKEVLEQKKKLDTGKRIWDKTPWRVKESSTCPSMTSVTKIIHPIHDRTLTIREYARIMGYPDNFIFYPDECKTPIIQTIAQGVPKNFVKYIASEIKEALLNNRTLIQDSENGILAFQYHTHKAYKLYTQYEIDNLKELDHDKTFKKLEK